MYRIINEAGTETFHVKVFQLLTITDLIDLIYNNLLTNT